ncbi:MAG: Ig-like domain-containing protein, partial [Caldilineaceae bacterium]
MQNGVNRTAQRRGYFWLVFALLLALTAGGIPKSALAADGDLDPTFGSGGKAITSVGPNHDWGNALAVQSDGKIIVGGYSQQPDIDFVLVRYNVDGLLDTSFGNGGVAVTPAPGADYLQEVLIQSDGRILAVGYSVQGSLYYLALARYHSDGSPDTSYHGGGLWRTVVNGRYGAGYAGVLQSDGRLVVAGYVSNGGSGNDFFVARYLPNGNMDTSFGQGGVMISVLTGSHDAANALAIQDDGKIIAGGYATLSGSGQDFALVRYHSNGIPDPSFGFNGNGVVVTAFTASTDYINDIAIQDDGKIVAVGVATINSSDWAMARYNSNGSPDNTFGSGGQQTHVFYSTDDRAFSMALQPDGKLVVAGRAHNPATLSDDFALMRFTSDGLVDTSFGNSGLVMTPMGDAPNSFDSIGSIAIQDNGKILAAGFADNSGTNRDIALVRYDGFPVAAPPAEDFPVLFWSNQGVGYMQTSSDGATFQNLNSVDSSSAQDVEVDAGGGKLYWIETRDIKRANLDGTGVEILASTNSIFRAIGLDTANGHLYFVDVDSAGEDSVGRMNLDGSNSQTLFSPHTDLAGYTMTADIAFDPNSGYLYWLTTNGNELVRRALPDGTNRQTLIANPGYSPRKLRLDLTNQKMYWTSNAAPHSIQRANLDGTGKEILVTDTSVALGFDIDIPHGKMYWANGTYDHDGDNVYDGAIQRANLDGSDLETLIPDLDVSSFTDLLGLALISDAGQPSSLPLLDIPDDLSVQSEGSFDLPINFTANGAGISSVDVNLSFDSLCINPDLTDDDFDGVPDNFLLEQSGFQLGVDSSDVADGELQIVIGPANQMPVPTFADGALLTIPFDVGAGCSGPSALGLNASSWGDTNGQSANGETQGGVVTVNAPPTASNDSVAVDENTQSVLTAQLLANDSDPDGDNLTVTAIDDTGIMGVVSLNNGVVTYEATTFFDFLSVGDTAPDQFGYTISDGKGGTDTAIVDVTINGVNDAPVAELDDFGTDEDSPVPVNVIANDTDVDQDDTLSLLSVDDTGTLGAVSSSGDTVTYDPTAVFQYLAQGESADDSFAYTVTDNNGGTDTLTIDLTVIGVNDPPVANAGAERYTGVGEVLHVAGSVTDPDTSDVHTFNIAWGDGAETPNISGNHSYSAVGDYTLSVTAQDSPGASHTDTAAVYVRNRGDCNDDGPVDAGDLPALVLEFFDGDNNGDWLDVVNSGTGSFNGSPVGCDANADTVIGAGDLSCQIAILLDSASYSCSTQVASAAGVGQAVLSLGAVSAAAAGAEVAVPVQFESGGQQVSAAVFRLKLQGLVFDADDTDGDGLPDGLELHLPDGTQAIATQRDGGLDVVLFSPDLTPFGDGPLVTIRGVQAEGQTAVVRFDGAAPASLGDIHGS